MACLQALNVDLIQPIWHHDMMSSLPTSAMNVVGTAAATRQQQHLPVIACHSQRVQLVKYQRDY
jgi:hypothetical protein